MNTEYSRAFREVLSVLEQAQNKERDKIPPEILGLLQKHASTDYQPQFKKDQELTQLTLTKEAKIILSILYRSYLSEKWLEEEKYFKKEALINLGNLEKDKKENKIGKIEEEKLWYPVVPKKEKFFKKLFKRIKRIFKKEFFQD